MIFLFSSIVAGEDGEYWNWAWRSYDLEVEYPEDQRGDLIAFLPDGTINTLLSDIYPVLLKRINDSTAFVGIRQGDEWYLYYLSADSAHPVILLFDHAYYIEIEPFLGHYAGYDYFVPDFMPIGDEKFLIFNTNLEIYAIYDVASNQVMSLNLKPWCDRDCVRVSEDGRYIRYYVRGDDPYYTRLRTYQLSTYPPLRTLPYQLYEYDIVTQTERLFHEQVMTDTNEEDGISSWGGCTPDEYGERWFCTVFLNQSLELTPVPSRKFIVDTNGYIEDVNLNWSLQVLDRQWYFLDMGSEMFGCWKCVITVYPDSNRDESFEFIIPENEYSV
ncbi:MAG: hypothetical protein MUE54_11810, partial [Anaerolineae bacterium]|nr:hypothetical protein [Anaerolineae bacterium]